MKNLFEILISQAGTGFCTSPLVKTNGNKVELG
jgi:hypothetical protein